MRRIIAETENIRTPKYFRSQNAHILGVDLLEPDQKLAAPDRMAFPADEETDRTVRFSRFP